MKQFIKLAAFVCGMLIANSSVGQNIRTLGTQTSGGVTYTDCYDNSKSEPYYGAKVNGKLVVPCKYYLVFGTGGHLFAYPTKNDDHYVDKPADVYTPDGRLLFKESDGIVDADERYGKNFFKDQNYNWYNVAGKFVGKSYFLSDIMDMIDGKIIIQDENGRWHDESGRFVAKGTIITINEKKYFKDNDERWYDKTGKYIAKGYWIYLGSNGEVAYIETKVGSKYGVSTPDGKEVFAPEFDGFNYLGGHLFAFKYNGYWGVMNRTGKQIIPIDRHYTKIEYSRTLKIYSFEKRVDNVVYKGECNAAGKQLSIQKDHTINNSSAQKTEEAKPKKEQKTEPAPKPKEEKKTDPAPQPQPRQPQPMQVWVYCGVCGGSGQCIICNGLGWRMLANKQTTCSNCGGNGRCNGCAGQGGHNEVKYY